MENDGTIPSTQVQNVQENILHEQSKFGGFGSTLSYFIQQLLMHTEKLLFGG